MPLFPGHACMYTIVKPGLGRLPWVLFGIAACFALLLLALKSRASGDVDTVVLKAAGPLPAWKPGTGWATATPPALHAGEAMTIPRYPPWTDVQATNLFVPGSNELVDPWCGKLWKPNIHFTMVFPEHPDKAIHFDTNSRSMREDTDPLATKPALRVLVAGDSHTDGVCNNSESFPNLTEAWLRTRAEMQAKARGQTLDPSSIEVLNAGKGTHSFFNYLGVLEKNLDLQPDVFVVNIYGGNDFEEVLSPWHFFFNKGNRPPGAARYEAEITAAVKVRKPALAQAMISVKYFDANPDQKAVAVQAASDIFVQIQALCRERGIRLIVLYLPPWQDVEPNKPEVQLRQLLNALKLEPKALASTGEMADQLLARLSDLGIETVDLRPTIRAAPKSAYWSTDWHINLLGHQLIARVLTKVLSERP
ncbi:MAG: SGNH/GDSL hydrolase family protein [Planctomycetota bacterium]